MNVWNELFWLLLDVAWKVSLPLGLGLLVVRMRPAMSAATRHDVLLGATLLALLFPILTLVLPPIPAWQVRGFDTRTDSVRAALPSEGSAAGMPTSRRAVASVPAERPVSADRPARTEVVRSERGARSVDAANSVPARTAQATSIPLGIGAWIWLAGTSFLGIALFRAHLRARALRREATPLPEPLLARVKSAADRAGSSRGGAHRAIGFATSASGPVTLGIIRPTILLPAEIAEVPAEQRDAVILHELAHVQRNDVLWEALRRLLVACFWFHPLARVVATEGRRASEQACDDFVLRHGTRATTYATCLVEMSATRDEASPLMCAARAGRGELERRVRALLDTSRSRRVMSRSRRWGVLALAAVLLGPVALLAAAPAGSLRPESSLDEQDGERRRSRVEFAAAMSKLRKGMPVAEARALLGAAEDIKTQSDAGGITTTHTKEIWRYGTDGHLTQATLGEVYIDTGDRVQYWYGAGVPATSADFDEGRLRGLLRTLGSVNSYNDGFEFHPRSLIRAVNALQPLGKKRALAVIEEYLRISSMFHDGAREGMFLVMRALFEVPADPGHQPQMFVGASMPPIPKDLNLVPRFPLVIVEGVPFLMVNGYMLAGRAQDPSAHLVEYRKKGTLRSELLVPTDQPVQALMRFTRSTQWIYGQSQPIASSDRGLNLLGNQVLRLLDSTYRAEEIRRGSSLPYDDFEKAAGLLGEAARLEVRWNAELQDYVRPDGSRLPSREVVHYERFVFKPTIGHDVRVVVERQSETHVELSFAQVAASENLARLELRLEGASGEEEPLAALAPRARPGISKTAVLSLGRRVALKRGQSLRAVVFVGELSEQSDPWTP